MTSDKGILIKNVYYMLTYAFKELRRNNYEHIAGENFKEIYDLFAEILSKGVAYQLKQGLHREYVQQDESLTVLRGKLNISGTIRNYASGRRILDCEIDNLSEDNFFNRILKTTMQVLACHPDVQSNRKADLKRQSLFFRNVSLIEPSQIKWNLLRFDRNTQTYQMLLYVCFFVLDERLMSTDEGEYKMMSFSDDHMELLFQRFILEFYRKHHPELHPQAKQIDFNIDYEKSSYDFLPIMQTDALLTFHDRKLIIDAKYYKQTMQEHWGKITVHSPHFYQILSYVTSLDRDHSGKVDGMVLYAKTEEGISPDFTTALKDGNILYFKCLDLNKDFEDIKNQLEELINN